MTQPPPPFNHCHSLTLQPTLQQHSLTHCNPNNLHPHPYLTLQPTHPAYLSTIPHSHCNPLTTYNSHCNWSTNTAIHLSTTTHSLHHHPHSLQPLPLTTTTTTHTKLP
ncbi:hypothetical protein Pcinc_035230 [Petrolisthes cinctipes]|uniref:Uncharacterized protein n=1 Tax=Petrolisthes cinctipes TaxID=88211 RepID=A0AAE1BYB9_PETCI|nr:hypothetical protein Pcinc_035230 [Petrolisthes cinctipes]